MQRMFLALALICAGHPGAAVAQSITNVNECTFITDPIALRRCIDGFQLRGPAAQYPQSAPIPPIETPAQAERNQLNSKTPPKANDDDVSGWLDDGDKKASNRPASKRKVIDLSQ